MKLMYDGDEILVSGFSSSATTIIPAILPSSGWDENQQQVIDVPGVLSDESKQLIIPVPFKAEAEQYYDAGIRCIDQLAGQLKFSAETVPESDLQVYVVIVNVQAGGDEGDAVYEWWSPQMTSNTTPNPFIATASSVAGNNPAFHAFDGNKQSSMFHSQNIANSYIEFDFGQSAKIAGIRLIPYPDETNGWAAAVPKKFTVESSNDGDTWDTIFISDGTLHPTCTPGENMDYKFGSSFALRCCRITSQENYGNYNYFIVNEIEFLLKV